MDEHGTAGEELKTQDGDAISAGERQRSETLDSMHTSSTALGKRGRTCIWGMLNRPHEAAPLSCALNLQMQQELAVPALLSL